MRITGTHIAYLHICKRKLWLFSHGVQMEHTSGQVSMGAQISKDTYKRKKKELLIDGQIALDLIDNGVIHEVKKSNKAEYAHKAQLLYYLWFLEQKGNTNLQGRLDYPLLKLTQTVILTEEKRTKIKKWIQTIKDIVATDAPISPINKRICKKCSYYEYCYS